MARFGFKDMKEKYQKLYDYYKTATELAKPFWFDKMPAVLVDEYDDISGIEMCYLLEFFSKGVRLVSEDEYLDSADYIYERVVHEAYDTTFGGYYEKLTGEGKLVSDKKLLETQLMAMVALGEYACAKKITKDEEYHYTAVLNRALAIYTMLEHYSLSKNDNSYLTEMNADWSPASDVKTLDTKIIADSYHLLYANIAFIDSKATGTLNLISDTISRLKESV